MINEMILGIAILTFIMSMLYNFPEFCVTMFFTIAFSVLFIGGAYGIGKVAMDIIKYIHVF